MLRHTIDRARLGLLAFYDIWPGNGVSLFLQHWNPHGVQGRRISTGLTAHLHIYSFNFLWVFR